MSTSYSLKPGDRVTFDADLIEDFKAETDSDDREVQRYRKLVLAGVNHVGIITDPGDTMTTVLYEDGWELPVPVKYLVVLPEV